MNSAYGYVRMDVFDEDATFEEETLPVILSNDSVALVNLCEKQIAQVRAIYSFEINNPGDAKNANDLSNDEFGDTIWSTLCEDEYIGTAVPEK